MNKFIDYHNKDCSCEGAVNLDFILDNFNNKWFREVDCDHNDITAKLTLFSESETKTIFGKACDNVWNDNDYSLKDYVKEEEKLIKVYTLFKRTKDQSISFYKNSTCSISMKVSNYRSMRKLSNLKFLYV